MAADHRRPFPGSKTSVLETASDDLQYTNLLVETVGQHVTPMVNIHALDGSLATASSCGSIQMVSITS